MTGERAMQIKRTLTFIDEVRLEAGQRIDPPLRKVAVVAVIDNPFAGRFERDLSRSPTRAPRSGGTSAGSRSRCSPRTRPKATARPR